MRTLLFFLVTILLANSTVFAQKTINGNNPAINLNDFKHPQQYFLDTYGKDDSTRALINYFFRVRKAAAVEVAISLVAGGGLYLFANYIFGPTNHTGYGYGTVFLAIFAIPLIPGFAVGVVEGTVTRLIFTREKLLELIADYQQGKHLPKRVTHKRRFRQEMERLRQ